MACWWARRLLITQLGSLADAIGPALSRNFFVNIDERQSLAVHNARHLPVVFDDCERFKRKGRFPSRLLFEEMPGTLNISVRRTSR